MKAKPKPPTLVGGQSQADLDAAAVRVAEIHARRPAFDPVVTDISLMRSYVDRHAGALLYSHSDGKWLAYRDGAWRENKKCEEHELARVLQRDVLNDAASIYGLDQTPDNKLYLTRATKAFHARDTKSIVVAATSDPRLATAGPEEFDRDPSLLNATNGIVDLRTGTLAPHDPEQRMRKQANASFDPDAPEPSLWLKVLDDWTGGDAEYVAYLQRMFGLMLTGHVSDELMFFMYGLGSNGKSVFCAIVQHILGDYFVVVPPSFLMEDKHASREGATPSLMKLAGARVAFANETDSKDVLSAQMLKVAVSVDPITARPLYKDPVTFAPTHKLLVRGQHKPIVHDQDHGLWRRIHMLPFTSDYGVEKKDDKKLTAKLRAEADSILTWAVGGAVEWFAAGRLEDCAAVRAATSRYREDSDVLGRWIEDKCGLGPDAAVEAHVAYASYKAWAAEQNLNPLSEYTLTRRLGERRIEVERRGTRAGRMRFYVGIRVRF